MEGIKLAIQQVNLIGNTVSEIMGDKIGKIW